MAQGGARGQNLEHLIIFFLICFSFSFMDSFVFRQHALFMVDFLSVTLDHTVQCPKVGPHGTVSQGWTTRYSVPRWG